MKKIFNIFILACSVLMFNQAVTAQHTKTVRFSKHQNKSTKPYSIKTHYPTTGITACIDADDSFSGAWLVIASDTLSLKADEHNNADTDKIFSNLLTTSNAVEEFIFYPGAIKGEVSFTYIDSRLPNDREASRATKKKSAGCSEPAMIEQTEWRTGLPDPDYERIPNEVHNQIIHHSAGSNTDNNYTQVIRSIYIYHTETRGWSDIGYNYVIAQDGSIFMGRDPGTLQQDSVMGAHFCNSNSGTMGICLLGDYTDIIPTDTALASLVKLLNWKAGKSGLDPSDTYPHTLNAALPVIAGHRDGCATACPGNMLYALLENIRDATQEAFTDCNFSVNDIPNTVKTENQPQIIWSQEQLFIKVDEPFHAEFFNLMGVPLRYTLVSNTPEQKQYKIIDRHSKLVLVCIHTKNKTITHLMYLH